MKSINKNKIVIQVGKNQLVIDRIKPPTFYIKEHELTEYDMRNLQLEVNKGNIPYSLLNFLKIKDEYGVLVKFREDGCLTSEHKGYKIISLIVLEMLGRDRQKSK